MARLLVTCGSLCLALTAGLDSGFALVQGIMQVQDSLRLGTAAAASGPAELGETEYLVDNSKLMYRGPGVLYRSNKDILSIVSKDLYAPWGSTVEGIADGDWVKVGRHYLPVEALGKRVLVSLKSKAPEATAPMPEPARLPKLPWEGASEVQVSGNSWVSCNITSAGSLVDTYNIIVRPRIMPTYPIENVPLSRLRKVQMVAEQKAEIAQVTAPRPAIDNGPITLKVEDDRKGNFEVRLAKQARFLAAMRMACDYLKVEFEECRSTVVFKHNGKEVLPEVHLHQTDLKDNDTIKLTRL